MWWPSLGCFHASSFPLSHGRHFQVTLQGSGFSLCLSTNGHCPGLACSLCPIHFLALILLRWEQRGLCREGRCRLPVPSEGWSFLFSSWLLCWGKFWIGEFFSSTFLSIYLFVFSFVYSLTYWKCRNWVLVQWEALWWLWEDTKRRWDSHLAFEELNVGGDKRHEPRPW